REITVSIPAGVDTGTRLRLRDEGETGRNGGPRGDLYVFLEVEPSEHFERRGANLHYEASLNFAEAALGCEVEVPTLEGTTTVSFEPGTQFGDVKLLQERGVQHLDAEGRGDLHVHAHVTIPQDLDSEERDLLSRLERLMSEDRAGSSPTDEADETDKDDDSDVLQPDSASTISPSGDSTLEPPEMRVVGRDEGAQHHPSDRLAPTGE
ncbi:MAG: DnaJ C-terminal domain-containing protein, partial [Myxococcota bacterium]